MILKSGFDWNNDTKEIFRALNKAKEHLLEYDKVFVSISGGSDSDVMLDLLLRAKAELDKELETDCGVKFNFVFFDTGIEYEATKRHLDYLEEKYNIKIERIRAEIPVPLGCKTFGIPFLTKFVSEMIERLQKVNFDFTNDGNKDYDYLMVKYPKCKSGINWWTDCSNQSGYESKKSRFAISQFPFLKEFMIEYPPDFKISNKCCKGAKKDNAHNYIKNNDVNLQCLGIRQSEGGVRATAYKSCFSEDIGGIAQFRPIFWFSDKDKKVYDETYGIKHSDCYEVWGFKRTGCGACPFGSQFDYELQVVKQYEPKLYNACLNIFGKSYEYTNKYREFKARKQAEAKAKEKIIEGQMSMFDLIEKN